MAVQQRNDNVLTVGVCKESSFIESRLIGGVETGGERAWHCWADEGAETSGTSVEAW